MKMILNKERQLLKWGHYKHCHYCIYDMFTENTLRVSLRYRDAHNISERIWGHHRIYNEMISTVDSITSRFHVGTIFLIIFLVLIFLKFLRQMFLPLIAVTCHLWLGTPCNLDNYFSRISNDGVLAVVQQDLGIQSPSAIDW